MLKCLDANKAHGLDDISIRMPKLFEKLILKPLKLIFENCLITRLIKNYRPVSLLPICGKLFERLIFSSMINYSLENNRLSPHELGFISGDPCVQQFISITHEIYNAFDYNTSLEVRGVFLDVSKSFYKV